MIYFNRYVYKNLMFKIIDYIYNNQYEIQSYQHSMKNLKLPKDIINYCLSFLSEYERNYCEERNWYKFPKNDICSIAAYYGWLDLLKWGRSNNCFWNEETCAYTAYNGYLDVLKWLRENGCPWNSNVCAYAAHNGHLEILKWAKQNG